MESKKFVNLNANYRSFLTKADEILARGGIGLDTPLSKLQKIHDDIERLFVPGVFERNDVNHLLKNCESKNEALKRLKDYVYLRNVRMVERAIKDDKYNEFVGRIKSLKDGVSSRVIDRSFIKVVKGYFEYWDGVWKFIEANGTKIKNIDIIDPADQQSFYDHLK
jgi:hypothetical protein